MWHLLGPSSKGQSIFKILFNTHAPARSLQKDYLLSIHTSRRLTCHHYNHQLSSVIQVHGDSKHQAQPMNQSFVAAINATTSYKPIVDPLRLARLYNHTQSGLTLPTDCFLLHVLTCTSIIMVFTTIILTKSVQYWLSRQHVTAKKSPEHQIFEGSYFIKQNSPLYFHSYIRPNSLQATLNVANSYPPSSKYRCCC